MPVLVDENDADVGSITVWINVVRHAPQLPPWQPVGRQAVSSDSSITDANGANVRGLFLHLDAVAPLGFGAIKRHIRRGQQALAEALQIACLTIGHDTRYAD